MIFILLTGFAPSPTAYYTRARRREKGQVKLLKQWVGRLFAGLSATGIVFGTILFCASLTPSLLPRTWLMQGVLCGFSFAIGYLIGVALTAIWTYLELPHPRAITGAASAFSSPLPAR